MIFDAVVLYQSSGRLFRRIIRDHCIVLSIIDSDRLLSAITLRPELRNDYPVCVEPTAISSAVLSSRSRTIDDLDGIGERASNA